MSIFLIKPFLCSFAFVTGLPLGLFYKFSSNQLNLSSHDKQLLVNQQDKIKFNEEESNPNQH